MSIENNKLMNLADGKVLYDDLRGRIEAIDDQIIISATEPTESRAELWIDNGATNEHQVPTYAEFQGLTSAINVLEPSASAGDVGKVPKVKTVSDGKVSEYEFGSLPSVPVTDVQVNGTSILSQGVANVPVASENNYGAVKTYENGGTTINSDGKLILYSARPLDIKQGNQNSRPIVPANQKNATFYGLASAAGDTTQSASSNTVGNYTEDAKRKITDMIEPKFRLIKEITITEETANILINTDTDGGSFLLKECVILLDGVKATNNGTGGLYVNMSQYGTNDPKPYLALSGVCSTSAICKIAMLSVVGGMFFGKGSASSYGNNYTSTYDATSKNASGIIATNDISEIKIGSLNGYNFTEGTIKVYGR